MFHNPGGFLLRLEDEILLPTSRDENDKYWEGQVIGTQLMDPLRLTWPGKISPA